MRALLINPWIYDFKAFDFWNKPIGLLITAALLKKTGFAIDFIDCMDRASPYYTTNTKTDEFGRGKYNFEIVEKPAVFRTVRRYYKRYGIPYATFLKVLNTLQKPDIIFITSSMTYWYPGVFEAIRILKKKFSDVRIVLGGIYATLCAQHAAKFSGADFIITGPVEEKIGDLLQKLGFVHNSVPGEAWIMPDFSLYKNLNYGVIFSSHGCPFDCTYCATKFLCNKFSVIPNQLIIEQLEYFSDKTKNIAFFDDALLYNKNFPLLLEEIIKKKYRFDLHASNGLHCRFIDKQIAKLMLRANFKTIYLSLETINPEVQLRTGNKVKTAEFTKAVDILKKTGFSPSQLHTYILYGIPGQGYEEIIEAIKLCKQLKVHSHLCEFSPIPHTAEFIKSGLSTETDPLYHNNLFYTWYYPHPKLKVYKEIKHLLSLK